MEDRSEMQMPRDDSMATSWFVKVEGRVYGPYTPAQMRAFVQEGRVAPHSEVSQHREEGWAQATDQPQIQEWLDENRKTPEERQRPVQTDTRQANFVVVAHLSPTTAPGFAAILNDYGDCEKVADGVWLLRSAGTAATLRNELSHMLDRDDRLLVVDASRDRTAWFNLGRDADHRIRDLWSR